MVFFFFNDTATTEIYTLSLHDALPILLTTPPNRLAHASRASTEEETRFLAASSAVRSEEHTSELQSPCNLVCRLLLEKKNLDSASFFFKGRSVPVQHLPLILRLAGNHK